MDKQELILNITKYINENETISQKELIKYINILYNNCKEKKEPSLYNIFVKEQMEIIKKEDPTKKDKMKYIAKLWSDKKPEVKVKTPRKLLR